MRIYQLIAIIGILSPSIVSASSHGQQISGVLNYASTTKKVVALTFDADMTPKMLEELKSGKVNSWYNATVISTLKKEHVPATLFLTGMWIETYTTTTKELSDDPLFELGNHSYSHGGFRAPCYGLNITKESNDNLEIEKTDALLKKYTTSYVKYFRFPGLCFDSKDVRKVEKHGYVVIGGNVRGGDGFQENTKKIVSQVVDRVHSGSIVILHMHGGPDAPQTANALPCIIQKLRAKGFTFVKVSDLI